MKSISYNFYKFKYFHPYNKDDKIYRILFYSLVIN